MLKIIYHLTFLMLTIYTIESECCTKVTFVNTIIKVARKGEFEPTTSATITGCITPEIINQQLGQVIVTQISCFNQSIPTLHEKAVSNLPELTSLKIARSKIKRIQDNAFFNLPKLDSLDLDSNEISTLNQNVFQNLNLELLILSGNKIVFLEHGIFANLPKLLYIVLSNNELETFDPEWFTTSSNLNTIHIQHNFIRTIQRQTLKPFKMLKEINFSFNHINYIHKNVFDGLETLKTIYLNDNRIRKLDEDLFQPVKNIVEALWLNGNNLTYMSDKTLKDLTNGLMWQMTIHTNPWQCACHNKILQWAHKNNVFLVTGNECYNENNVVCVIPEENEDKCLEIRDEDLNSLFYEHYNYECGGGDESE